MWQDYTDKFKMFHVRKRGSMLYSHKLRLMKYETGAKIHPHSDHDPYIYGSCTFNLNEEYEGGEFVFFRGNKKIELDADVYEVTDLVKKTLIEVALDGRELEYSNFPEVYKNLDEGGLCPGHYDDVYDDKKLWDNYNEVISDYL